MKDSLKVVSSFTFSSINTSWNKQNPFISSNCIFHNFKIGHCKYIEMIMLRRVSSKWNGVAAQKSVVRNVISFYFSNTLSATLYHQVALTLTTVLYVCPNQHIKLIFNSISTEAKRALLVTMNIWRRETKWTIINFPWCMKYPREIGWRMPHDVFFCHWCIFCTHILSRSGDFTARESFKEVKRS